MKDWNYKVPILSESRWATLTGPRYSRDEDWPTIGIFCAAESHDLWLIGSFTLSQDHLERDGTAYWSWGDDYPTGDGFSIRLGWQSRDQSDTVQFLVGDEIYDRDGVKAALREASLSGDVEKMACLSAGLDKANASMRSRLALECAECGDRVALRGERTHGSLSAAWLGGIRELSLSDTRRVL